MLRFGIVDLVNQLFLGWATQDTPGFRASLRSCASSATEEGTSTSDPRGPQFHFSVPGARLASEEYQSQIGGARARNLKEASFDALI